MYATGLSQMRSRSELQLEGMGLKSERENRQKEAGDVMSMEAWGSAEWSQISCWDGVFRPVLE